MKLVQFTYTNHRGETVLRRVQPAGIWFGKTQWHPKEQWLLRALDMDRNEWRDFAMSVMSGWTELKE